MSKETKIIAGPCSAESLDQCLSTAKQLSEQGINVFRAGVWKPRTKPGGFEGVGEIALNWLRQVRRETGMKVGCEVANKEQCELALMHNLDYIWIGARTTTDPFAVQEISDTIKKFVNGPGKTMHKYVGNLTVLVKNPVCPDYDLWVGAIERVKNSGVKNVGAIFRGFKTYNQSKYRNEPIWDIPLKLITEYPNMEVYCDPSHISGNTEYLQDISNAAIEYGFSGLMIESHCDPENGWTDAKQQVKPSQIHEIVERLPNNDVLCSATNDDLKMLSKLRAEVTSIDRTLSLQLIARMRDCIQIGKIKERMGQETYQKDRWNHVLKNVNKQFKASKLYDEYPDEFDYLINVIWSAIHSMSCKLQIKNK